MVHQGAPAVAPIFDAIGGGGGGLGSFSFSHTAALGADIFVDVSYDRAGGSVTGVSYNGRAMTALPGASVAHDGNGGYGYTVRFHLAGAGTGSAATVGVSISGSAWYIGNSISIKGVHSVGSALTAYGAPGAMSQIVSASASQLILQSFGWGAGSSTVSALSGMSGGTAHYNSTDGGAGLAISTATGAATFAATGGAYDYWGGIAHVLS
ncbi:hypothetical protein KXD96_15490 [Mycobacterium sp. SMC-2]|uniref:hypothetical protein n=1 Tax=Mycobacterium sp. SMC-2 TaxID=2857058 RepID=UPI0021B174F9|nr:hypothetical protein [Mycobacterium sp. SMC-2]UXA04431.1 hypothetical protein KXD96_15490 [Mycobacterium sp. SMC-2]